MRLVIRVRAILKRRLGDGLLLMNVLNGKMTGGRRQTTSKNITLNIDIEVFSELRLRIDIVLIVSTRVIQ